MHILYVRLYQFTTLHYLKVPCGDLFTFSVTRLYEFFVFSNKSVKWISFFKKNSKAIF